MLQPIDNVFGRLPDDRVYVYQDSNGMNEFAIKKTNNNVTLTLISNSVAYCSADIRLNNQPMYADRKIRVSCTWSLTCVTVLYCSTQGESAVHGHSLVLLYCSTQDTNDVY